MNSLFGQRFVIKSRWFILAAICISLFATIIIFSSGYKSKSNSQSPQKSGSRISERKDKSLGTLSGKNNLSNIYSTPQTDYDLSGAYGVPQVYY